MGLVGKYVQLHDAYLIGSRGAAPRRLCSTAPRVQIKWIDSETVTNENAAENRLPAATEFWFPAASATAELRV